MSVEKFPKHRAVNIVVAGTYTLPNWYDSDGKLRSFACRTSRVSPFQMVVDVPVVGRIGERLTTHFEDLGKLEATIVETMKRSFMLELEMTDDMREKLANKLTWLEQKQKKGQLAEARKDARMIPANPHSSLTLADGSVHPCFVIDVSSYGAAVSTPVQPPIGMPLAVGSCIGRVVRVLPDGFAIKFVQPQRRNHVERLIARIAPGSPGAQATSARAS